MADDSTGLTPEMIQAILASGGHDSQREDMMRRQAVIDKLRMNAMTPAQNQVVAGRVMPNWGSSVANLAGAYMAKQQQPEVNTGMEQVQQRQVDARKQYMQALMEALRRRQSPAPQPGMPGTTPPIVPSSVPGDPNMGGGSQMQPGPY
jgi:hypothetical protein